MKDSRRPKDLEDEGKIWETRKGKGCRGHDGPSPREPSAVPRRLRPPRRPRAQRSRPSSAAADSLDAH
eukprot:5894867-Pleurochrysis_carterae.AAC.2